MDTIAVADVTHGVALAARRRRSYTLEEKRRLVAESYEPGASVSVVARRHDLNANLLFTWRRQLRARAPAAEPINLIPIEVLAAPAPTVPTESRRSDARGTMEIILLSGVRVRVDADVSESALTRVLSALKAAA